MSFACMHWSHYPNLANQASKATVQRVVFRMRVCILSCWSNGVNGMWRDPWPIWGTPPTPLSLQCWISDCWLWVYSPLCSGFRALRSVPPQLNWLRSWKTVLQLSEIAERLSQKTWQSGVQLAITHRWLSEALFWVVLLFSSGFSGILLSLFPRASCFWMRAFLVLSTGPCQPGCSAQPSPASTTAPSAKTELLMIGLLQQPNLGQNKNFHHSFKNPPLFFS